MYRKRNLIGLQLVLCLRIEDTQEITLLHVTYYYYYTSQCSSITRLKPIKAIIPNLKGTSRAPIVRSLPRLALPNAKSNIDTVLHAPCLILAALFVCVWALVCVGLQRCFSCAVYR